MFTSRTHRIVVGLGLLLVVPSIGRGAGPEDKDVGGLNREVAERERTVPGQSPETWPEELRPKGYGPGPVTRSDGVLARMPHEMRWEFTRRHPYYLRHWVTAADSYAHVGEDRPDRAYGNAACALLRGLGVRFVPVRPDTTFDALGGVPGSPFRSGAVSRVRVREGLLALLYELTPLDRAMVGHAFLAAGRAALEGAPFDPDSLKDVFEDLESAGFRDAERILTGLPLPGLDTALDLPIVKLNLYASDRQIGRALVGALADMRRSEGVPVRRPRPGMLRK